MLEVNSVAVRDDSRDTNFPLEKRLCNNELDTREDAQLHSDQLFDVFIRMPRESCSLLELALLFQPLLEIVHLWVSLCVLLWICPESHIHEPFKHDS